MDDTVERLFRRRQSVITGADHIGLEFEIKEKMEAEGHAYDHYKKGIDNAPVVHCHKADLFVYIEKIQMPLFLFSNRHQTGLSTRYYEYSLQRERIVSVKVYLLIHSQTYTLKAAPHTPYGFFKVSGKPGPVV